MNQINIRIATTPDGSAVTATLLQPNGQPVQVQKISQETGKTKIVDLAGSSILRGRTSPEDMGQPPRIVAINRLMRKIQALPELIAAMGWTAGEQLTPVFTETALAPVKKASTVKLFLAGFNTGATPAEGPVEGHISLANEQTGTDCGLVTVSSNRQAYNVTAEQATDTVMAIAADFAEQNLDTTGLTTMMNSVMEAGAVGPKTKGYFRQDGEGRAEGSKSDIANPMLLPTMHRAVSTADSLNKRKGVAGLKTTEADCRQPGAFLIQKTAAKRNGFLAQKSDLFKEEDPRIQTYLSVFKRNPAFALGKEVFEKMSAEQTAYHNLRKEKAAELAESGLRVSYDNRRGEGVQKLAMGIGHLVARAELGLSFGSKAEDASETDRVIRTWIDSTIARGQVQGLTIVVHNGQVLINDKPVTWHKAAVAAELELRAVVNG